MCVRRCALAVLKMSAGLCLIIRGGKRNRRRQALSAVLCVCVCVLHLVVTVAVFFVVEYLKRNVN